MKKLLLWIFGLVFSSICFAQAPNNFKYQAVARDASGKVMENQNVSLRISILQGSSSGTVVFRETHSSSTNEFGLLNLNIGNGTSVSGSIEGIQWAVSDYYISVEMDPEGGSNYSYLGSGQLLSVPYALHAKTAEDDKVDDADADPANEIQNLSLEGNVLTLSKGGGTVTLSEGGGDNWGSQIVLTDATLEGAGTGTAPLKIARQGATPGQVLKWNGSTWLPLDDNSGGTFWQQSGSNIFYNDGYVGIGTDNPNHKFHIHSDSNLSAVILTNTESGITNSDGMIMGMQYSASLGANFGRIMNLEDGPLYLGTNSTSHIGIDPGGNVGIGTLSPGAKLDVVGSIKIRGGTPGAGKVLTSDATGLASWQTPSGSSTSFWQQSGDDIYYDSGKVGIGITDPVGKLHIHGEGNLIGILLSSNTSGSTLWDGLMLGHQYFGDASSQSFGMLINNENTPLMLGTDGVVKMSLLPNGDFGIGLIDPSTKLDINGQIKIRGGLPGAGKVLTSDATGLASWQTPSGSESLWQQSGDDIYYNSGSVGIGTDSPLAQFHLVDWDHTEILLTTFNSGAGSTDGFGLRYIDCDGCSSHAALITYRNVPLEFRTDNKTRMLIDDSGDVNIGTGSASSDTKLIVNKEIVIKGGSPGVGKVLTSDATGLASWQTPSGSSDSDWSISGSDMYSQISGNVGIGNTNPDYKLDVMGNRIRLIDETNDWIAMRTDGSSSFLDLTYSGGHLAIQGVTDGENIVLVPAKNSKVGIRTWLPAYTLDVNGDIRATGSVFYGGTVGNTDGTIYIKPDFVFTDDYETLSTGDVEKFIKKNNHLPWITSAKQEKQEHKDVIDMTRMAFESVETIENLQLQIIELNKKVDKLVQLVYKQQKEIKKLRR